MSPLPQSPNLVRSKSFEEENTPRKLLLFFQNWGRFIILIGQLLVVGSFFWRFILDEQLVALNRQLLTRVETIKTYAATEKTLKTTQARLTVLKAVREDKFDPTKILDNLSLSLPQSINLTQITLTKQSLQVEARTASIVDFAKLLNNLKSAGLYKEIILKSTWYRAITNDFLVSLEMPIWLIAEPNF